jgi:hypothetical protein
MNIADATHNRDAIPRQQADGRYYLNTTPLNLITAPASNVSMNSQRITSLAAGTIATDAVTIDQLTKARQGFSIVRKTTTAQTAGAKVTGFTI